jgi:hypothetical protein
VGGWVGGWVVEASGVTGGAASRAATAPLSPGALLERCAADGGGQGRGLGMEGEHTRAQLRRQAVAHHAQHRAATRLAARRGQRERLRPRGGPSQ